MTGNDTQEVGEEAKFRTHIFWLLIVVWGSWAHKAFCVLHFWFLGSGLQPP